MMLEHNENRYIHKDVLNNMTRQQRYGIIDGCKVEAQNTPNMTLKISSGKYLFNGNKITFAGEAELTLNSADSDLNRYDLIVLDNSGNISALSGIESLSDDDPTLTGPLPINNYDPNVYLPIARVFVGNGVSEIIEQNIKDLRVFATGNNDDNLAKILSAISDITLINEDMIKIMEGINDFKIVDLFVDNEGSNKTVNIGNTTASFDILENCYINDSELSDTILEPSFETIEHWNFTKNNSGTETFEKSSEWKTKGEYSGKLYIYGEINDNPSSVITQNVNLTNIDKISFDFKFQKSSSGDCRFDFKINNKTKYSNNAPKEGTIIFDVSSFSGVNSLSFNVYKYSGYGSGTLYIDNMTTGGNYINSIITSKSTQIEQGYKYAIVRPKLLEKTLIGAELSCNISLDGATTFSAEKEINSLIDLTGLNDIGELVVKLNLKTNGYEINKIAGWSVMLF